MNARQFEAEATPRSIMLSWTRTNSTSHNATPESAQEDPADRAEPPLWSDARGVSPADRNSQDYAEPNKLSMWSLK
jgi:hypothetical protein